MFCKRNDWGLMQTIEAEIISQVIDVIRGPNYNKILQVCYR
jgi:hypothetical protein